MYYKEQLSDSMNVLYKQITIFQFNHNDCQLMIVMNQYYSNSTDKIILIILNMNISIPKRRKQARSGSVNNFESQLPTKKKTDLCSTKRHASSRSEITTKNLSNYIMDYPQSCCSGHGIRIKQPLNYFENHANISNKSTITKSNMNKKYDCTKQFSLSTSSLGKPKKNSKLENYENNVVSKLKLEKTHQKKSSKPKQFKNIDQSCTRTKNGTISVKKGQKIKKSQIINIEEQCQKSMKSSKRRRESQKCVPIKYDQNISLQCDNYLKRENTPADEREALHSLATIQQKKSTEEMQNRLSKTKLSRNGSKSGSKTYLQNLIDSQQTLKRQLEHYQEQTISELKLKNAILEQQLSTVTKNNEAEIENHHNQIMKIIQKGKDQHDKIRAEALQYKCKQNLMEVECNKLEQEKVRLTEKFNTELTIERKQRQCEKQQLLKRIFTADQKYNNVVSNLKSCQQQRLQAKQQLLSSQNERHKYENMVKKCENQINILEQKLQQEIKKNKSNIKQLQILKSQKQFIKQNSQLILEIVRSQINQMQSSQPEQSTSAKKQNWRQAEQSAKKALENISPRKKRILSQANI